MIFGFCSTSSPSACESVTTASSHPHLPSFLLLSGRTYSCSVSYYYLLTAYDLGKNGDTSLQSHSEELRKFLQELFWLIQIQLPKCEYTRSKRFHLLFYVLLSACYLSWLTVLTRVLRTTRSSRFLKRFEYRMLLSDTPICRSMARINFNIK